MSSKKRKNWKQNYEIIDTLGSGGNAKVFCVKDKKTGQEFALKKLYDITAEKRARFEDEIQIMKQCSGIDGIIPIVEAAKSDCWYVMPIAKPIVKYISESESSIEGIVSGIVQLSGTLSKLHAEGISHRDIKPANIYFYNGKYCLGDFGLVEFPDCKHDFTKCNRGLGPIFTIAPEMKRNPKKADGKSADVYSLAKTLWILLTKNEKGFEGTYNYLDKTHSLHSILKYKNKHLVELEELLTAATRNDPKDRPTIDEFRSMLETWLDIIKDFDKAQISDWDFLRRNLFGQMPPSLATWDDYESIAEVLDVVAMTPAYNHMMLPNGGGLDLVGASIAPEDQCIYLESDVGILIVIKPKKLHFVSFKDDISWNYFYMELDRLEPIGEAPLFSCEHLVEDIPGHYVSAKYSQYGVYDYDSGRPLPEGYKEVTRYNSGNMLIVLKRGVYNKISATYDGRHSQVSFEKFSQYFAGLKEKYNALKVVFGDDGIVLNLPIFSENPFKPKEEETLEHSNGNDPQAYLANNYSDWDFASLLQENEGNSCIAFYIVYTEVGQSIMDIVLGQKAVLCKDGMIRKINRAEILDSSYLVHNRELAYEIAKLCDKSLKGILSEQGYSTSEYVACFDVELRRTGNPSHLFTKEEIKEVMQAADDRLNNMLVIDEFGYAHIISDLENGNSYPVRLESWDAGNNYVGKYSQLHTLDDSYTMALEGWLEYLKHCRSVRKDWCEENLSICELIEQIQEFYSN